MHEEILERCEQILKSLAAIQEYMSSITSASDFLKPESRQLHLDAITLRLQVIGENVKQMEIHQPQFYGSNWLTMWGTLFAFMILFRIITKCLNIKWFISFDR